LDPKNVSTPVHWTDVVHSGRLGADDVDGAFDGLMEGANDGIFMGAGDVDGVDDGLVEGADDADGLADGMNVGINEGLDDVDGSPDGVDDHDEVKGLQIGLELASLFPYTAVLK